ncbi:MAG TPA: THUMP domain-containing protein [Caldimonas sp.]|nr:THUMP domain-containing protein [Caldimonas sp.]
MVAVSWPLFLPCAAGVEELLAEEVIARLPHAPITPARGGVGLVGGPADVMTLNLESRLAQRVLVEVGAGPYRDEHDLYQLAASIDWSAWLTPRHTLRVDVTAQRSPLRSLHFAGLRIKDAVCDQLRDATGQRPSVDTRHPDLQLVLHVGETRASLAVDTSGEPLFKRGWRMDKGDAPLKETLAAAMLAAAGWRGTADSGGALHDPCCGSGTIAIEAAQIACGIAPGLKRPFAFERLLPFASPQMREQWQALKAAAQSRIHPARVPISGADISFRMVDFARRNAVRAGVDHVITFNGGDALERPAPNIAPELHGTLMLNPPYGERIEAMGKAGQRRGASESGEPTAEDETRLRTRATPDRTLPNDFYAQLAAHWKRAYAPHPGGWTAWVLSPDAKLPSALRLKESRRVPMWNGPIECRLFRFELVLGSAREKGATGAPQA